LLAGALLLGACSSSGDSGSTDTTAAESSGPVDRSPVTLNLAGLGIAAQFPGAESGAQARIKEFNDNAELEGVTLNWVEYANDNQDQATALSEARRLVSSEDVFALVGVTSQVVPAEYLTQQEVPWFGWGFDNSYCATEPSTELWGFGWNGCLVNSDPPYMPDAGASQYRYVSEKTGKDKPTVAVFSNDTESGRNSAKYQSIAFAGNGFDVVLADGIVAPPPVADYTPYVQQLMTSANGSQPDAIQCLLATDCIPIWTQLKAQGYSGTYVSSLYSDAIVGPMDGSVASWGTANFSDQGNAYLDQMTAAVKAVKPDQAMDSGVATGYMTTDMLIQAIKTAAEKGNDQITGVNVQKVAANQSWEASGFTGPTNYPASTVAASLYCNTLMLSNGTEWQTVDPLTCSDKTWPVN